MDITDDLSTLRILTPEDVGQPLIHWLIEKREIFQSYLRKSGAILFRGFGFRALSEFHQIAEKISPNLLDYTYRSTPRTALGGKIFSSTEYPNHQTIPLHCENSYSNHWPKVIMFFSIIVAETGGQTPIANMHKVYQSIPKPIRDKFCDKKILYVRNYHEGIDLHWKDVFQTEDKKIVENYCQKNGIEFQWKKNNVLETKQICDAIIEHPDSKLPIWFNQVNLFHIDSLPLETKKIFLEQFSEEELPRNTYYGDGKLIETEVLHIIQEAYLKEKKLFAWQRGDILVLDNCLMSHGREPFTGARKVVVAMG